MIQKILISIALIPVIYLAIALFLIAIDQPVTPEKLAAKGQKGIDFSGVKDQDLSSLTPVQTLDSKNGSPIHYRFYQNIGKTERLIVLIHGSGWHSMQYPAMAKYLTDNNLGHVVTPDLRGHGENPQRRGDVDYIGQMEDDLAELIASLKEKYRTKQVIVAGHSSGGGLVIRMAGGKHGALADGWVLLAPFIRHDAPTARVNAGGWAHPMIKRIIGLSMLNGIGITALNNLTAIQFNMPEHVRNGDLGHTATLAYSHRLNTSFAPRPDYGSDLKAMSKPLLLLAGKDDEVFRAEAYQPTISAHTDSGEYHLLDNLGHIDLVEDVITFKKMHAWLDQNF